MNHLLLILLGGPVAIGTPFLLAHLLVEGHANLTAESIRAAHAEPAPAARPATVIRPKELTR